MEILKPGTKVRFRPGWEPKDLDTWAGKQSGELVLTFLRHMFVPQENQICYFFETSSGLEITRMVDFGDFETMRSNLLEEFEII